MTDPTDSPTRASRASEDERQVAAMFVDMLQGVRRRLQDFKNYHATTLPNDAQGTVLDVIQRLDGEIADHINQLESAGLPGR